MGADPLFVALLSPAPGLSLLLSPPAHTPTSVPKAQLANKHAAAWGGPTHWSVERDSAPDPQRVPEGLFI
jgi:hypothetical protein